MMESEAMEFQNDYYEEEFVLVKQEQQDVVSKSNNWKKKEKKTIDSYKQLIVPVTMKSAFWEYFGFPADAEGAIISKEHCICSICGAQLSYCQNTTNLRSHLRNRHKAELKMLTEKQQLKLSENTLTKKEKLQTESYSNADNTSTFRIKKKDSNSDKRCHYEMEEVEEHQFEVQASEHSMGLNSNFQLVDDSHLDNSFQDEVEEPKSKIMKIDPTQHFSNKSPKRIMNFSNSQTQITTTSHEDVTNNILKMIYSDLFSLDITEGPGFRAFVNSFVPLYTMPDTPTFVDTITKYLEKNGSNFYSLVKQTVKDYFSICFEKWENSENKSYLTISINILEVASFELQNIVVDVVEYDPTYNWNLFFRKHEYLNMKEKCFGCVMNFVDTTLMNFIVSRNIPLVPCLVSCLEKAIESTLNLDCTSSIIDAILNTFESSKDPLSSIQNSWLYKWEKMVEFKEQLDQGTLSVDSELEHNVNYMINFLQPIKVCMELLADLLPSGSLIKPLLEQLIEKHLSVESDDEIVIRMKENINEIFAIDERSVKFLNAASFLDPRFNQSFDIQSLSEVKSSIKEDVEKKTGDLFKQVAIKGDPDKSVANDNKLKRLSFIFNKDSPKMGTSSVQGKSHMLYKFDAEFDKYVKEESISIDKCPGKWWTEFGYVYSNLKKIADFYFSVPHSSHTRFKTSIKEQIEFVNRRKRLTDINADKIMFLHYNKDIFDNFT